MTHITQPSLFVPHGGGPCFFMEWDPPHMWDELAAFLKSIPGRLPAKPAAIIVVSAHWETTGAIQVTSGANPGLIYDYAGFPPHTYSLTYPAPGHPQLANRVVQALQAANIPAQANPTQGWDHGVFIPLKVAFPEADIPVVQVSLPRTDDAAQHWALGQALAPFRAENVLILASGMSYHNMRGLFGAPGAGADAQAFTNWLQQAATQPDAAARQTALLAWEEAPAARASHPHAEHFYPLLVAAGAGQTAGQVLYHGQAMGVSLIALGFGQ